MPTSYLGEVFDQYILKREQSVRGLGLVCYYADHQYLNRKALVIFPDHPLSLTQRNIFIHDTRDLAGLTHPHIIRVLNVGIRSQEDIPYMILEYSANGTLEEKYPSGQKASVQAVVKCIVQIAAGLQYAHDLNFLHLDVRPDNIFIRKTGDFVLGGFELGDYSLSGHPDFMKMLLYMPPEAFQLIRTKTNDQYALAIVAYRLLTGYEPFTASTDLDPVRAVAEMLYKHRDVPAPLIIDPVIPQGIKEAIYKALAKDPMDRFPSVLAFAKAISDAVKQNN